MWGHKLSSGESSWWQMKDTDRCGTNMANKGLWDRVDPVSLGGGGGQNTCAYFGQELQVW